MQPFYARTVLFVRDAPRALGFYTSTLGFALDWTHEEEGKPFVVQVSLHGMQIILNQTESDTHERAGHGRIFIGLGQDQADAFTRHVLGKRIPLTLLQWGGPTVVIDDLDRNQLFFWLPEAERLALEKARAGTTPDAAA